MQESAAAHTMIQPQEPPYQPPERRGTPTGIPRWPQDSTQRDQASASAPTSRTGMRGFGEWLVRARSSPRSTRQRHEVHRIRWQPPTSGQTDIFQRHPLLHPFHTAPVAEVATSPVSNQIREELQSPRPTCKQTTPNTSSGPSRSRSNHTSVRSASSALSDAQRALTSASGNAIVVTPRRASLQASLRTATVPKQLQSPDFIARASSSLNSRPETGTTRTAELLQSFPDPPAEQRVRKKLTKAPKRASWSLFPRTKLPPGADRVQWIMLQPRSVQSENQRRDSGVGIDLQDGDDDQVRSSAAATRDQSQARVSTTRTPIFDEFTTSFRNHDRHPSQNDEPSPSMEDSTICKHQLAKRPRNIPVSTPMTQPFGTMFDGSNAFAPAEGIRAQDHALTSISPISRSSTIRLPPQRVSISAPSLSAAETFATAPSGTTFVSNPGGSTFALEPAFTRAGRVNTLGSTTTAPGRA